MCPINEINDVRLSYARNMGENEMKECLGKEAEQLFNNRQRHSKARQDKWFT